MTEREELLAAIRENPDDNVLRGAYADHLDGSDVQRTTCSICDGERGFFERDYVPYGGRTWEKCICCNGTGTVVDDSDKQRAALIRIQIEYANETSEWKANQLDNLDMYLDPDDREDQTWKHRVWDLKKEAQRIIHENDHKWRSGGACKVCDGAGSTKNVVLMWCPACAATGRTGGLVIPTRTHGHPMWCGWCYTIQPANWDWNDYPIDTYRISRTGVNCYTCGRDVGGRTVTYDRGMMVVECTMNEVWRRVLVEDCPTCHSVKGQTHQIHCSAVRGHEDATTQWARTVCEVHRDVVEFKTNHPYSLAHPSGTGWFRGDIPDPVFTTIRGHGPEVAVAQAALGRGLVKWVHDEIPK